MNFDREYNTLRKHYLQPLNISGRMSSFYLRESDDSRHMSTLISFTPEGIVLQGDLTPSQPGNVSVLGYGVGWFGSKKSPYYLAEKFLSRCYEEDRAEKEYREYLTDMANDAWETRDIDLIQKARKLRDFVEDEWDIFRSGYHLHDSLSDFDYSLVDDGIPWGWDYPSSDFCWLAAIQKRFSEVYQEWIETEEGVAFLKMP